ncbi:MAG: phenylalanine--tRNA ligase subunit beta, partial [Ruminococcus sp.]|nr:phenylalanine--tRNA ligase subunit beta [Ruminococcus sp.]
GRLGIVHPTVMKKLDKRACVVFAEIDVDKFAAIASDSIVYREPSKFPGIDIDLSFLTGRFAPIKAAIDAAHCELIKAVDVIDIYEDAENSSIAVRLTFSDNTRTLTRDEVTSVSDAIVAELEKDGIKLKG